LACECKIVASGTPPVRELITHDENGLLADFFDVDQHTEHALTVLRAPDEFRRLGQTGRELIDQKYTLQKSLPQMLDLYRRVTSS